MIRTVMVPLTSGEGGERAMSAGMALAAHHGAHLSLVIPVTLPAATPGLWDASPALRMSEVYAGIRDAAEQQAAELRGRLAETTLSWDVRVDEARYSEPPGSMAAQARCADVSVITAAPPKADNGSLDRALFSALLFESGRPVLVVPSHHPMQLPIRHAVVAWTTGREATRALHDALMFLEDGTSVDIVMVGSDDEDQAEVRGVDIAAHLARHGVRVNVVNIPKGFGTVATALLRHAAQTQAQLLVAGGYGHSRLREWILGGTTRELLQGLHLPVLFSH
jgi:nucleotide-binding universal stress UspA family protein